MVIRGLLLSVFVATVALAWRASRHMASAGALSAVGASTSWKWTLDDGRQMPGTTVIGFTDFWGQRVSKIKDRDLEHLNGLYRLRGLDLAGCSNISAKGLALLPRFKELRELHLSRVPMRGYARNRKSSKYDAQWLGPEVDDTGLGFLAAMPELEVLSVDGTGLTDAGLLHLLKLKKLTTLDLSYTQITDKGLDRLKELPELRILHLQGTTVTCEAVHALEQARSPDLVVILPRCEEGYDPRTAPDEP
jgi:hypothetical protein